MGVHTPPALSRRLQRLEPAQRLVRSHKQRADLHLPRERVKRGLTYAERVARKKEWATTSTSINADLNSALDDIRSHATLLRRSYGHSDEYWHNRLMQRSRLARSARKTSRWNAFLSVRLRQINAELPEGQAKKKANDREVLALIKNEWQALSDEDRTVATADRLRQITEDRSTRRTGENNAGIAAFHDAVGTFRAIENLVQALYVRTGIEVLVFAVRSSQEQWFRPYSMTTSDRAANFFDTCFNQDIHTYATRFEAYCLSGIDGLHSKVSQEIASLKSECMTKVFAQLNNTLHPHSLPKMVYADFFNQVTMRYHVIYENWPVSKFCSPGKLTLLELRRLHHVLSTGPSLFRRLSAEEWKDLDLDAFQANHSAISPTAARPIGDEAEPTTPGGSSEPTTPRGSSEPPMAPPSVPPAPPSAGTVFPPPRPLPPGPATGTSLTLDGGMVCVPKKRKKRWDAGLTKEQKAALKAVKEAEKAKKAGRQRGAGSS